MIADEKIKNSREVVVVFFNNAEQRCGWVR